ncbi:TcpE family conjugal transfer membrane protein [Nonomuraea sp. B12E4]|uniref:TcpE family conjugal transfer membrane protein n=1 Tax=Nonomuraea sp. B12E4 TaxID=3153564 RepID=UPI00325DBB64
MDLPTYTNIWRIEKRLYKLYDLRLPMPLPIVWIGVFVGVFVPWSLLLVLVGVPVEMPWHVLFLVPPGIVTWLSTRPVIEGKRLTELLESQLRYLGQPKAWCRLAPMSEPETIAFAGRVWRIAPARAKAKAPRKARRPQAKREGQRIAGPRQVRPAVAAAAAAAATAPVAEPATTRWGNRRGAAPALRSRVRQSASSPAPETGGELIRREEGLSGGPERLSGGPERRQDTPLTVVRGDAEVASRELGAGRHVAGPESDGGDRAPHEVAARGKAGREARGREQDVPKAADGAAEGAEPVRGDLPTEAGIARGGRQTGTGIARGGRETGAGAARGGREMEGEAARVDRLVGEAEVARGAVVPIRTAESRKPAAGKPIDTEALRRLRKLAASADAPVLSEEPADQGDASRGEDEVARDQHRKGQPPRLSPSLVPSGPQRIWSPLNPDAKPLPRPAKSDHPAGDDRLPGSVGPLGAGLPAGADSPADDPVVGSDRPAGGPSSGSDRPVDGSPAGSDRPATGSPAGGDGSAAGPPSAAGHAAGVGEDGRPGEGGRSAVGDRPAAIGNPAEGEQRESRDETTPAAHDVSAGPAGQIGDAPQSVVGDGPRGAVGDVARGALGKGRQSAGGDGSKGVGGDVAPGGVGGRGGAGQRRDDDRVVPMTGVVGERVAPGPVVGDGPGEEFVAPVPGNRPGEGRVRRVESVVGRDSGGWRRIAQVVVGGGGVRTDGSEVDEARARGVFGGSRRIVVLGCTGGAGQSTTALMLGHTFAKYRDDRVVAVDANTGGSTLTSKIQPETPETLTSLLSGLDRVSGYLTMRGYTTRTASGLEVIGADSDAGAEQRLADRSLFSDHRLGESMRLLDHHYKLAVIDPAAALAARVLPYADQLVLVVPASEEASEAVAMTYEWLDGHGCAELRRRAVMVVNGVSRRSMADVEQAESVASGRCRAIVRVPWEDDLAPGGAEVVDPGQLRAAGRRAYLALAGVVVAGFAAQTVRLSEEELASDPPGTRIGER